MFLFEKFKKELAVIAIFSLFLNFPVLARAETVDDLKSQIQQSQNQIRELEKQIAAFQEALKDTKSESATLKSQIGKMETQIRKLQAEVSLTQAKISQTSFKIEDLSSEIETRNIELEKQKANLGRILFAIDEYDQETPFEMILKNQNFSDFLNQAQYVEDLQNNLQQKVRGVKETRTRLEEQKTEYENQKNQLQELNQELKGKTSVLDNQRDEKQDLLATTKNQEKQYQAMLADLQKKRDQIENEIYQAEEKLRLAINPSSIPGSKKGVLIWPIQKQLTQSFGCLHASFARKSYPSCDNGQGGYHNGIDIAASIGLPVKAALEGTVSGIGNLGKYSYGKWITVRHDNGLTTLYAQKLKTRDAIGYAGSTGYSTGAHLHFTVYASNTFQIQQKSYGPVPMGGSINPMLYLP